MRITRGGLLITSTIIFGVWVVLACGVSLAQGAERYFPETGLTVSGPFLAAYEQAGEPELVFGLPITEPISDPYSNNLVQYFQRGRFELVPDPLRGDTVDIADLGVYLYLEGRAAALPPTVFGCKRIPGETRSFRVCYEFLNYFIQHGGSAQFGRPVSNLEWQHGRLVQYFERSRFEWRPGNPPGQRVVLGDLGSEYLRMFTDRVPAEIYHAKPPALLVRAAPAAAITGLLGEQTITVNVRYADQLPASGVEVSVQVRNPAGELIEGLQPVITDKNGLARIAFPFDTPTPGQFTIQVSARQDDLEADAATRFLAWY